jgi:hypothetical protein
MGTEGADPKDVSVDNLWWEFEELCEFPWPNAPFVELKRYVRSVHEFLPHMTAQEEIRLRARIKIEGDPVAVGELESELELVRTAGTVVLPRLVWGGVLVSIYAAYEFGVESVLNYWKLTARHSVGFKLEPKRDFLQCAEEYSKRHLGAALFASDIQGVRLKELKTLRNSFVHRGSQLSTLPEKLRIAIARKEHPGLALEEAEGQWIANARSAAFYLLTAERTIKSFGEVALQKCLANSKLRQAT